MHTTYNNKHMHESRRRQLSETGIKLQDCQQNKILRRIIKAPRYIRNSVR